MISSSEMFSTGALMTTVHQSINGCAQRWLIQPDDDDDYEFMCASK